MSALPSVRRSTVHRPLLVGFWSPRLLPGAAWPPGRCHRRPRRPAIEKARSRWAFPSPSGWMASTSRADFTQRRDRSSGPMRNPILPVKVTRISLKLLKRSCFGVSENKGRTSHYVRTPVLFLRSGWCHPRQLTPPSAETGPGGHCTAGYTPVLDRTAGRRLCRHFQLVPDLTLYSMSEAFFTRLKFTGPRESINVCFYEWFISLATEYRMQGGPQNCKPLPNFQ